MIDHLAISTDVLSEKGEQMSAYILHDQKFDIGIRIVSINYSYHLIYLQNMN